MKDIEIAKRCGAITSTKYKLDVPGAALTMYPEELTAFREAVTKELREQVVVQQVRIIGAQKIISTSFCDCQDGMFEIGGGDLEALQNLLDDDLSALAAHDIELLADVEIAQLKYDEFMNKAAIDELQARIDAASKQEPFGPSSWRNGVEADVLDALTTGMSDVDQMSAGFIRSRAAQKRNGG